MIINSRKQKADLKVAAIPGRPSTEGAPRQLTEVAGMLSQRRRPPCKLRQVWNP